jgi:hypothetical protein
MSKSDPAVPLTPRDPTRIVIDTAESEVFKRYLDFLNEYEAICETALAP